MLCAERGRGRCGSEKANVDWISVCVCVCARARACVEFALNRTIVIV